MPLDKRVSFPLNDDYFSGGSNLTGPEGALEDILNQLWEDFSGGLPSYAAVSTQTDAELHLYADAAAGNDLFDGLTAITPKRTLASVFALLPNVIRHNVAVHLNGTFTDFGQVGVTARFADNVLLVVDGGDQLSSVAGPFMATASTDESITVSGAGWTPDAFAGYFIEVTGGAQQGALFSIQGNTADTIIPCKKWPGAPGNVSFRVAKPATTLQGNSLSSLSVRGCSGYGRVYVQRMSCAGPYLFLESTFNSCYSVRFSHIVNESSYVGGAIRAHKTFDLLLGSFGIDPANFGSLATFAGASVCGASFIDVSSLMGFSLQTGYAKELRIKGSPIGGPYFGVARGARASTVILGDCIDLLSSLPGATSSCIETSSGYPSTKISGSSGVGLTSINSTVSIGSGVEIDNNASHGIEARRSAIEMRGSIMGANNGGAGIYAHQQSSILIKDGSPPTLSGAIGDVSVDGTTQATGWNSVAIGSPFVDVPELTMVKEVP